MTPGDLDWTVFWTAIGSIAAMLGVLCPIVVWIGRRLYKSFSSELHKTREENARLRSDLDTRFRLPSFALDTVRLTEKAAERKIQEIEAEHQKALREHDQHQASRFAEQLEKIRTLQSALEQLAIERERLENQLENMFAGRQGEFSRSGNAVLVPTGFIIVVRENGCYGAILPIDQSGDISGGSIRYAWWYQPDGSTNFTSPSAQFGHGDTSEGAKGSGWIKCGPIDLEWSQNTNGFGFVYFGPISGSPGIELAVSREIDVRRLQVDRLRFLKAEKRNLP